MMRRHLGGSSVVLCALLAFVVSCGDSGPEEPDAAGFWDIWSIDGQALPVMVDLVLEIEEGSLDLRVNGSYAFAMRGVVLGERWEATQSGQWSQSGAVVSLNPNAGCTNSAVLERRDVLKIAADCEDGREIVFAR